MGNHDAFLLDPDLIRSYSEVPVIVESVDWCQEQITPADREFLGTFRPVIELLPDPQTPILLFHGSPRSNMEDLWVRTPAEEVDLMMEGHEALVMAGGHTHLQMLRQHHGALIINPGSVGLPFKEHISSGEPTILTHAEYAIIEADRGAVTVELHRLPLERSALYDAAPGSDLPLAKTLVQDYS